MKAHTSCVTKLILPSCDPLLEAFGVTPRDLYPLLQRVCTHIVGHVGSSREEDDRIVSSWSGEEGQDEVVDGESGSDDGTGCVCVCVLCGIKDTGGVL